MRRVMVVGLTGLAACAGGAKASSAWSPKAAAGMEAQMRTFFTNLDAFEVDKIKASYDDNPTIFDTDSENHFVAFYGLKDTLAYLDQLGALGKQGVKLTSVVNRVDCQATETMGFCTIEFDQSVAVGGQTMGPFKLRGTSVGRKVDGAWKWSHWHGSFREAPPAAAPAPPAS